MTLSTGVESSPPHMIGGGELATDESFGPP